MEILDRIVSRFSGEGGKRDRLTMDSSVEKLDCDLAPQLIRKVMTLSRRRRCAAEHLGGNFLNERAIASALETWYLSDGFTKETVLPQMLTDLQAIYEDPTKVSKTLKDRILLTNYFSKTGEWEDCYGYGEIEPLIFKDEKASEIGLRDTFSDKLPFAQRVEKIISFDPEVKGFRHQIRYFRALLSVYAMAHLLSRNGIKNPLIDAIHTDERDFALGWLSLEKIAEKLSIDLFRLPPDESLLYNGNKVVESASLFKMYATHSQQLLNL